jgi:hypothetical protein
MLSIAENSHHHERQRWSYFWDNFSGFQVRHLRFYGQIPYLDYVPSDPSELLPLHLLLQLLPTILHSEPWL